MRWRLSDRRAVAAVAALLFAAALCALYVASAVVREHAEADARNGQISGVRIASVHGDPLYETYAGRGEIRAEHSEVPLDVTADGSADLYVSVDSPPVGA